MGKPIYVTMIYVERRGSNVDYLGTHQHLGVGIEAPVRLPRLVHGGVAMVPP